MLQGRQRKLHKQSKLAQDLLVDTKGSFRPIHAQKYPGRIDAGFVLGSTKQSSNTQVRVVKICRKAGKGLDGCLESSVDSSEIANEQADWLFCYEDVV
jgi:hypothetical protein